MKQAEIQDLTNRLDDCSVRDMATDLLHYAIEHNDVAINGDGLPYWRMSGDCVGDIGDRNDG